MHTLLYARVGYRSGALRLRRPYLATLASHPPHRADDSQWRDRETLLKRHHLFRCNLPHGQDKGIKNGTIQQVCCDSPFYVEVI